MPSLWNFCCLGSKDKESTTEYTRLHEVYHMPSNEYDLCIICLGKMKPEQAIVGLNCDFVHFYHTPCIRAWFEKKENDLCCPICRQHVTVLYQQTHSISREKE